MNASYYDYLTGLPTMTYFFEISAEKKASIVKNGGQPSLLFLSLHGMKTFNQKNGFVEGNKFIQAFTSILTRYFDNDNCCRLGGVHFAVIADDLQKDEILHSFFEDFKSIGAASGIYPHIGIYQYKIEDVSINMACDRAKLACNTLKNSYEAGVSNYNQTIRYAEEKHRYIIENFSRAISERWITVYYQPIVRTVNDKVCDTEALARWIDPVKGFLSPAEFIPILEEEKLIYKLDLYVVERIIEKIKRLESLGISTISQSINLSRADFDSCDIVEEIRTRVDIAGISRSKLNIEITESVIGKDFDFIMKQILRFKELGFSVWMDDFGSGYSSLNVLKEIPFDLIKFDMSFMRQFDQKNNGKIILAELMKMAFAIGVDTICEGVETEEQLQFLREIGCSKIQGFYYGKPTPLEQILEQIKSGKILEVENPNEAHYYETLGRVNLHDLAVLTSDNENDFNNIFNTIPMAVVEVTNDSIRYIRSNLSYRNFFKQYFSIAINNRTIPFELVELGRGKKFLQSIQQVAKGGSRTLVDEYLPDGSTVNYILRKLAENPFTNSTAIAIGILSIRNASQGATYENIAKALTADYYNLFYVSLETDEFIEYSSIIGEESITRERHGENFFEEYKKDSPNYLYEEDQEIFNILFTKENIMKELDKQGSFSIAYRMVKDGSPFYVNMKIMRMHPNGNYIIVAISNIDSQMKQKKLLEIARQEQILYSRLMSLSGDFIAMYVVDPETEEFTEYSSAKIYNILKFPKNGSDFFALTRKNAEKVLLPEDVEKFKKCFTKENIMQEINKKGIFTFFAHLILDGKITPYCTRIALVKEFGFDKLIVGTKLL